MTDAPLVPDDILPTVSSAAILTVDGKVACGARKKSGQRCQLAAGYGTTHHGYGPCKFHLGHMKETTAKAARDQMQDIFKRRLELGDISPEDDPEEVLVQEIKRSHAAVDRYDGIVGELQEDDLTSNRGRVILQQWNRQREMLVTVTRIALQAGIMERQTQVLEIQAVGVIKALDAVLNAAELDLTPEQRGTARRLMAASLRQITVGDSQRMEMQEIEQGV
jgi:hypothetical protein